MKRLLMIVLATVAVLSLGIAQKKNVETEDPFSKIFTVQPNGVVQVNVDPGAVAISVWGKNEVFIEAIGVDERHPERLEMKQNGNTITVNYHERRGSDNTRFLISVPAKFNVEIQTTGGSVKLKDALQGDFKAETKGGSVKIDEVTGTVNVETGGGSIDANKLGGPADIETGGGSVTVKSATSSLKAKTGGGSISLGKVQGKTQATTGGGSIKVDQAGNTLLLETGGGSINLNGASAGASVSTGGGSIEMEQIKGFITAKTGGGSIRAELIPDASGKSTIKTGGGDITIYIPENSKSTIEATINQRHGWGGRDRKNRIVSDFKADSYEGDEESSEIHAMYTLNGGGHTIILETSNSDIEIRKLK